MESTVCFQRGGAGYSDGAPLLITSVTLLLCLDNVVASCCGPITPFTFARVTQMFQKEHLRLCRCAREAWSWLWAYEPLLGSELITYFYDLIWWPGEWQHSGFKRKPYLRKIRNMEHICWNRINFPMSYFKAILPAWLFFWNWLITS